MSQAENIDENENIFSLANPKKCGFDEARLARIPTLFQSYLDKKRLAGYSALIVRKDQTTHFSCGGTTSLDTDTAVDAGTIFRIYSMSKPLTSVALMMLFEQGLFRLDSPVEKFLPEFANMEVWHKGGSNLRTETRPAATRMTIHHLLTHTSGLTYDFMQSHPVDRLYRHQKVASMSGTVGGQKRTLEENVKVAASLPLLFEPGSKWNYSISTDVVGRLIEVLSGMALDDFMQKFIFDPLQMSNTGFFVPKAKHARLAANYAKNPKNGELMVVDKAGAESNFFASKPTFLSGGGGLVSTIGDYARFCQMMLGGGVLDGVRLLSPRTIDFMAQNHLPQGQTLDQMSVSTFSEARFEGTGFGLGFSVIDDPAALHMPMSAGTYSWGGAASTFFWIDPKEEMFGILMTQFMPSSYYPIRDQLQQLTYAALI